MWNRKSRLKSLISSGFLVGLTELDSNKCKAILHYKHQLKDLPATSIMSEESVLYKENRAIDEFGEIAVKKLQQPCRIDFSEDDIQEIIDAYHAEKTTAEIAKQFNCSKNTISTLLKKHGVAVSKCKAQKKLPFEVVVSMYLEKRMTMEKIANYFGVSSCAIRTCLQKNNVKIRSRWDY